MKRTEQIVELGYWAHRFNIYGGGKTANNPDEAGLLMNKVLQDKHSLIEILEGTYNFLM